VHKTEDKDVSKKTKTRPRYAWTAASRHPADLAGELVINKARFVQIGDQLEKAFGKSSNISLMHETVTHLMRITNELQEGIMQLRMVAIDQVFSKFPRIVRDTSRKLGKQIELAIVGKETELDKSVVEIISDPLMHLIRNAVDHGIETTEERRKLGKNVTGIITLRAYHQGSSIVIEIEDDGKGLDAGMLRRKACEKGLLTEKEAANLGDREAMNIIFLPGFSTAAQVSDLSGRGVGMDVVRRNVEQLNGVIDIASEVGKVPVSLSSCH